MWRLALLALLLAGSAAPARADGEIGSSAPAAVESPTPVCTFIPPHRYPEAVQNRSLSGMVLVWVYVDEKGRVDRTQVLSSDLPELFVVEALKAARSSRFDPPRADGKTVRSQIVMPFAFEAQEAPPQESVEDAQEPEPELEGDAEEAQVDVAEPVTVIDETGQEPEPAEEEVDKEPAPARDDTIQEPVAGEAGADAGEESTTTEASNLTLVASGLGRGMSLQELTGRDTRFVEGSRVYYWTRVRGAAAGEKVKHVWIYRGRVIQEIELELKGPDWRTWSYKTLYGGMAGVWEVEARDIDGRLLGRDEFTCEVEPREDAD